MDAMWSVLFYTVLAVAAFYFILLQPVLKKNKERKKAVQNLHVGDEIVTTGGIIGEVVDVVTPPDAPTEIVLQIAPGIRVRALTEAVDRRLTTLEDTPIESTTTDDATTPAETAPSEVSRTSA